MRIPTEPIGSIPRPLWLIEAVAAADATDPKLDSLYEEAVRDTIERFEATGSPVISDGEQRYAHVPVKQAVISPSAMSLMYPARDLPGYSREQFIHDLLQEHETEVRNCLEKGAHAVQIDFTEARLAVKLDPTGSLLHSFIDLNNLALARFSPAERKRIGVDIRDRVLEAAEYIPVNQLGTTDDCGFSPFFDDTSTSRDTAFAKIHARVLGTALAGEVIGRR